MNFEMPNAKKQFINDTKQLKSDKYSKLIGLRNKKGINYKRKILIQTAEKLST